MMENIIEGILAARYEAEKRGIEANAVLINDRLFFSELMVYPVGKVPMICGLRAFYYPALPDQVLFAVAHVPMGEIHQEQKRGRIKWVNRPVHAQHTTVTDEFGEKHFGKIHNGFEKNMVPYCEECGKRLDDTWLKFCPACGVKLEEENEDNG